MVVSAAFWMGFVSLVLVLLALDLGLMNRGARQISVARSLWMSAFYIAVAVLFGGWIWWQFGADHAMDYFTGYAIEKSLSLDNIFVIALIFSHFSIPPQYQHRVLLYGILGVIVMRAVFIGLGAALLAEFHWLLYVFGAFLVFTGFRMLFMRDESMEISHNPVLAMAERWLRVTDGLRGERFFVREGTPPALMATPLFLALLLVESADLVFAVDSIPAIFAITQEPFIVYTSNIFAILGLRALYFALGALLSRFHYLKYALSLILVFIGGKLLLAEWVGKLPASITLGVTLGLLLGGVALSLYKTRKSDGPQQV